MARLNIKKAINVAIAVLSAILGALGGYVSMLAIAAL